MFQNLLKIVLMQTYLLNFILCEQIKNDTKKTLPTLTGKAYNLIHYLFCLAQVSRRDTVLLNTNLSSLLSGSRVKYPFLKN